MPESRTRKLVITGALGAITILLGWTHWGIIPWFSGVSITIMHVPVIIGAVLEGPIVGAAIGLIFGLFSLFQNTVAPTSPTSTFFTYPYVSVLPRLFIGPVAWLVWRALKKFPIPGLIAAGIAGSLTNTILVLGTIGALGWLPWQALTVVVVTNGVPEAAVSALLTLAAAGAAMNINIRNQRGADL